MISKYPFSFFRCASFRDVCVGSRLKTGKTMFAKTCLRKNRIRVFKLGMPVQVVHPNAVDIKFPQQLFELINPVFFKPGVCWTYSHKPCRLLHFLPAIVNSPCFWVFFHIIFTVECGKLCKHPDSLSLRPFYHGFVNRPMMYKNCIHAELVKPKIFFPESIWAAVNPPDLDFFWIIGAADFFPANKKAGEQYQCPEQNNRGDTHLPEVV